MNKLAKAAVFCLVGLFYAGYAAEGLAKRKTAEQAKWESLFDGKTLNGWTQRGGKAKYFVEDGCIVGETVPHTPNSFLCTEKHYADFILELEFKADERLNSGVQIRSNSFKHYKNGRVHGYQVEIDPSLTRRSGKNRLANGQPAPRSAPRSWTGGIYDEGRRGWLYDLSNNEAARKAIKRGEWNHLRIEAIGDSIKTWLNGVPAADLKDSMTASGFIGLQVHGTRSKEPLQVRWRNIRIKDLGWPPGAKEKAKAAARPATRTHDPDPPQGDAFMGDWQGKMIDGVPIVAQVIAYAAGKYQANLLPAFDKRVKPLAVMAGQEAGGKIAFRKGPWWGEIGGSVFKGGKKGDKSLTFKMEKTVRLSPRLGARPPAGAIVLFDGTGLDQWQKLNGQPARWKLVEGGAMEVARKSGSIATKRKFTDIQLHLEFRTPFMPGAKGQRRGNSGVYLQRRYEVQVLDSYGLAGKNNECGGIYKVAAPKVNMCAPPLQWQSYDITFRAPRFDRNGKKVENARVTVIHNGVTIHENLAVPHPTGGGRRHGETPKPDGLMLQDHGNPVQFRNIWAVDLSSRAARRPSTRSNAQARSNFARSSGRNTGFN